MTADQLIQSLDLDKDLTYFEAIKRKKQTGSLSNPVYIKHISFAWLMHNIWGHVECGNMSPGKARELTAYAVEKYLNEK